MNVEINAAALEDHAAAHADAAPPAPTPPAPAKGQAVRQAFPASLPRIERQDAVFHAVNDLLVGGNNRGQHATQLRAGRRAAR